MHAGGINVDPLFQFMTGIRSRGRVRCVSSEKSIGFTKDEEKEVELTERIADEIADMGDKLIRKKGFVGGVVAEEAFVPGLTVAHIYIKDPAEIPSVDVTMKYRRDYLGPREVKVKLVEESRA